jgi:hypothetical protein
MNQIEQAHKLRHRLLQRQIRKATVADGSVDYELLLDLVSAAYAEQDHNRIQHDRALSLMSIEMMEQNEKLREQHKNLEDLVARRTQELLKTIAQSADAP